MTASLLPFRERAVRNACRLPSWLGSVSSPPLNPRIFRASRPGAQGVIQTAGRLQTPEKETAAAAKQAYETFEIAEEMIVLCLKAGVTEIAMHNRARKFTTVYRETRQDLPLADLHNHAENGVSLNRLKAEGRAPS